jgi:hypothetical protein
MLAIFIWPVAASGLVFWVELSEVELLVELVLVLLLLVLSFVFLVSATAPPTTSTAKIIITIHVDRVIKPS